MTAGLKRPCHSCQLEASSNTWISFTSTDSEKHPSIHRQTEPKTQRDVLQLLRIAPRFGNRKARRRRNIVRDLRATKSEEEEKDRANILAAHGDEMIAHTIRKSTSKGDSKGLVVGVDFVSFQGIRSLGEGHREDDTGEGILGKAVKGNSIIIRRELLGHATYVDIHGSDVARIGVLSEVVPGEMMRCSLLGTTLHLYFTTLHQGNTRVED